METIKLVLLKSGYHIITKLSELNDDSEKPICFLMEVPFVVFTSPNPEEDTKIGMAKFMPYSKSPNFRISFDEVVTIGEPQEFIVKKYIEIVYPHYPIVSEEEYQQIISSDNVSTELNGEQKNNENVTTDEEVS